MSCARERNENNLIFYITFWLLIAVDNYGSSEGKCFYCALLYVIIGYKILEVAPWVVELEHKGDYIVRL